MNRLKVARIQRAAKRRLIERRRHSLLDDVPSEPAFSDEWDRHLFSAASALLREPRRGELPR